MSESQLRRELKRNRPFCTAQQEVVLSLLRTGDQLENRLARFFRKYELTLSQFSLLRVLQMEARPMTCGEIGERMIRMVPAVTRVVDRLEKRGLVARQRCADDRRLVHVSITEEGSATIDSAYPALLVLEKELLRQLHDDELRQFLGLMDKTRRSLSRAETASQSKL